MDLKSMQQDGRIDVLRCPDRMIFKGWNGICFPDGLLKHLSCKGLRVKDFGHYCDSLTRLMKACAEGIAAKWGREPVYVKPSERKEDVARGIARRQGITAGPVAILKAVEPCESFRLQHAKNRPTLAKDRRRCLTYYFYLIDRVLGFVHVRIPTWLPFTIQVHVNGHDWLAARMRRHRLGFEQVDNAFVALQDVGRAQALADEFARQDWPLTLNQLTRPFIGRVQDAIGPIGDYYWVTDQSEFSVDYIFKNPRELDELCDDLIRHAMSAGSADVLRFLGKRSATTTEVLSHLGRRYRGIRVKLCVGSNWLKVYTKHGCILRLECVTNDPTVFRRWRAGEGPKTKRGTVRLRKGVADMRALERHARKATQRLETWLSGVSNNHPARQELLRLGTRILKDGRSYRALNPSASDDLALLRAVMAGEHAVQGFRNADIRLLLHGETAASTVAKRQAAAVGRKLAILRAHGLIARIQRSHRWRLTEKGARLIAALLKVHDEAFPAALAA